MSGINTFEKIRIAFLCSFPMAKYNGGVATITNTLTKELLQRDIHVIYIAICSDEFKDLSCSYVTSQFFIDSSIGIEALASELNKLLKEENINCVINMATELWSFDLLELIGSHIIKISTLERKPYETDGIERMMLRRWFPTSFKGYVWKILGIIMPFIPRLFYNSGFTKEYSRAIESSDYYVVLSEKYKEILFNHLKKVNQDKVVAIANPNSFPLPQSTKKEKIVLFCGRMENQCKNVSDLLRAWLIVENHYDDWRLDIIGDGEDMENLRALAIRLGLKKVKFCGFVDDKKPYFETSSIICVTSLYEGWCTVLTEGMINRCVPVVYDTFQSAHDIIDHQVNGFFVEQNNYKNLASILIKLMSESSLETYAEKAALAISEFTPSNIANQWIELIQKASLQCR